MDVALLSALIAAFGSEGLAEEALTVFRRMVRADIIIPEHVTQDIGTSWPELC